METHGRPDTGARARPGHYDPAVHDLFGRVQGPQNSTHGSEVDEVK